MPAPASTSDFLDLVRKSGLVPPDRLAKYPHAPDEPVPQVADELVQAGLLTFFQAKQLQQGRYKRFQIAGKYRLLELLGVGGMGAVYLCEHEYMKRLVAVKVLPVDKIASDRTALQRFYREAQAVAALSHPNIVHAYDIDKFDTVHFLVMEYVDGTSLHDLVARYAVRKQHFDITRAVQYVAQTAAGLQHAAAAGLIHRDVKPGNLLLDRSGVVKVLDLGLARFFDHRHDGLTERFDDQCVLGTADFLAPEQVTNDQPVDVRADVYGLGGTLYYLLTASSPFPDGTVPQKLVAAQTQKPKPIPAFRPDVPPELLAIVDKMMEKDPADRHQSMVEVLDALAPWTATPVPPPAESEMPLLSPAVLERMAVNPMPGRSSVILGLPGGSGSGSSVRVAPSDRTEATVPTRRTLETARIHPESSATVRPRLAPSAPAAAPVPVPAAPPVVVRPRGFMVGLLFAIGGGSFLLASLVIYLVVVLLVK